MLNVITQTPTIKEITGKISRMGFKKTDGEAHAKISHTYLYDGIEVKKKLSKLKR